MPEHSPAISSPDSFASQTLPRREMLALTILAAFTADIATGAEEQKKDVELKVGDTFPAVKLRNVAGEEIELSKIGKDKVVLVDFWGVWCGPCMAEIPALNAINRELKDKNFKREGDSAAIEKGFEIFSIAVHYDDTHHPRWEKLISRKTIEWKHNVECGDLDFVNERYGVTSFPSNFLLDGTGKILKKNVNVHDIGKMLTEVPVKPAAKK